jgi:hypothetical protein|tara:strand:+ start:4879 stop:6462 length:1584 start_codon:yes stop_codon:yes gene_type:complete
LKKPAAIVVLALIICVIFYRFVNDDSQTSELGENVVQTEGNSSTPKSSETTKKIESRYIQNYPRFQKSIPIKKDVEYYEISLSSNTPTIDNFRKLVDSAYLLNLYREFLVIFREFINKDQVFNRNNPKFNFLAAIEHLSSGEIDTAKYHLHEFLSIHESYQADKDQYFNAGYDQYDIEWLEQPETYLPYQYAELIYTYLEGIDSSSGLDKSILNKLAREIMEIDSTPQVIDLGENIYYMLRKLSGNEHDDYKTLLKDGRKFLLSDLDIFHDQREYFLVSQVELVALAKFYQAKDIYNRIIWNEVEEDLYIKHIRSLFRFYDLNLTFLDVADGDLLAKLLSVAGDFEEEKQIASLVEFYKDLLLPYPLLPQTRMYNKLQMKILQEDFEGISEIVSNLNDIYSSGNSISSLDSVLHFVYQKELIDNEVFFNFPKHKSNLNYLPHLDAEYLERFQLLSKRRPFSFLVGEEKSVFSNLFRLYYSLYDQLELRTIQDYMEPRNPINQDNYPVFSSFRLFKAILEPRITEQYY